MRIRLSASKIIKSILRDQSLQPCKIEGKAFAPSNIALAKYWGKRNDDLNLPCTGSISVSLGDLGTTTAISDNTMNSEFDEVFLNGSSVFTDDAFYQRLNSFLDHFRTPSIKSYRVETFSNIPIAAGLASSASGFAALVLALKDLFNWQVSDSSLSIMARLGSGSASRSIYSGFVEWNQGTDEEGWDCFASHINTTWEEFCIGILINDSSKKKISSREAMKLSVATSPLYLSWCELSNAGLNHIRTAILNKDFHMLGAYAEQSALNMHQVMSSSHPSIVYSNEHTFDNIQKVWKLRELGVGVYFTQDAGPNIKLVFLKNDAEKIKSVFPSVSIIEPFKI